MDRRQALKRLAAGGAIAAGGSLVVSSNAVAVTTSGVEAPLAPFDATPTSSGTIQVAPNATIDLPGGNPTFAWQINDYSGFQNSRRLQIRRQSDNAVVLTGPGGGQCPSVGGCPTPPAFEPTGADGNVVLLSARNNGNADNLVNGNAYDVKVLVTWEFPPSGPNLVAEYQISGVWTAPGPFVALVGP